MLSRNPMNFGMGEAQRKNGSAYGGAIFLCSHLTRKECFEKKLFGLSVYYADFVQKVKAGATLFLYDTSQHTLHGVFEATTDGAMNIIPDAYISSGHLYPSQIHFRRIWFCKPLMLSEFQGAVQQFSVPRNEFNHHRPCGLSHQQVVKLLHLFCSRNRLQPCQNPSLHDELRRDSEVSSLANQTDIQSSPNSSSHGSFKSPCQTCSSSNLGDHTVSLSHKLTNPIPLTHSELQSDISDMGKSNSPRSSLHTGGNVDIVTVSGSHEMMDDKSIDDYIPLPPSVDDLSDLLEDESHSSESEGSSDSEEHTTFYQANDKKEDRCYPTMEISKLRSDSEGRTSVFSRLMGKPKIFSQNKPKTKSLPSKNVQFSKPLSQRKKQRRTQCNKIRSFDNGEIANRLNRVTSLDYSFVWGDNIDKRSAKSSGGKRSIKARLGPFICEYADKDAPTKEPGRYDGCKKLSVPEGSRRLTESCDRELNTPLVFAGVHESNEIHAKEQMGTPVLEFMQCAKDPNVGGDRDFSNEDVEESAGKKVRLESALFPQGEHPSDFALVPQGTKAMDILAISDENCGNKGTTLSSKDTCTQVARADLGTKAQPEDEQEQSTQECCEVIGDASLALEDSENVDLLPKHSSGDRETFSNAGTLSEASSGHLETEKSLHEKQNQNFEICHRVVNTDEMLLLDDSEVMDFLSDQREDCANKGGLPSDGNHSLVASSLLVTDLPRTNSESMSLSNDSSSERAENFDACALGSEKKLDQNDKASGVPLEMAILQHDPGDEMKPH